MVHFLKSICWIKYEIRSDTCIIMERSLWHINKLIHMPLLTYQSSHLPLNVSSMPKATKLHYPLQKLIDINTDLLKCILYSNKVLKY